MFQAAPAIASKYAQRTAQTAKWRAHAAQQARAAAMQARGAIGTTRGCLTHLYLRRSVDSPALSGSGSP
jgi:hypothetical protein